MKGKSVGLNGVALVMAVAILLLAAFPAQGQTLVNEKGKKWSFKLGTFFAYDDNVVNTPNRVSVRPTTLPTDADDTAFAWNAQAQFKHSFNTKWSVRANYDIDMTVYSDLSQYNLTSQMFGFSPQYKISPTLNLMLDYNYIYNIVDGDNFSGINYVGPSINHMHQKWGLSRLYYTLKSTDNWQNDLRDNTHHTFGAAHYFFFSNYTRRISIDYQYSQEDTTGSAFDRDNHRVKIQGKTPLLWGWDGQVDLVYTFRDYDSRLGSFNALRDDTLSRYGATLHKVLVEQWKCLQDLTVILKYRHLDNNSNLLTRDFNSNRGDIGLQARF